MPVDTSFYLTGPPHYGPDYNALAQMQRMQMLQQQQQQILQSENVLKAFMANQENFDKETGLPYPNKLPALGAQSPEAMTSLISNMGKLQAANTLTQVRNGEIMSKVRSGIDTALKEGSSLYHQDAEKNPGQATNNFRTFMAQKAEELSAGQNPQIQQLIKQRLMSVTPQQADAVAVTTEQQITRSDKQNKYTIETDFGKTPPVQYRHYDGGRLTDIAGAAPYTPTGVGETKETSRTTPKFVGDVTKDGKTEHDVALLYDGKNYYDSRQPDIPLNPADVTHVKGMGRESAAGASGAGTLSPEALSQIADQYLAGDKSALQGLGWGTVGSANRAAVRDELAKRGVKGADLAAAIAEFGGIQAGERTLGTRQANLGIALNEAKAFIPMGVAASEKVNRTQFPTLNSVILAYEKGTGGEDVVRLAVATNAISNAYAQVAARGGQSTDASRAQAREILENAYSKGQYKTAADQMMREIEQAQSAPGAVRSEMRQSITGATPSSGTQEGRTIPIAPGSGQPSPLPPAVVRALPQDGTPVELMTPNGKQIWKIENGKPVMVPSGR